MTKKFFWAAALLFASCVFTQFLTAEGCPPSGIDLKEKVLKSIGVLQLGETGFGIHDKGDDSFKIFDWNGNVIKTLPITSGEGPGQIRQQLKSVCRSADGYFFLTAYHDFKINKFSGAGKYITTFKTDFFPTAVAEHQGKLYAFNMANGLANLEKPFLTVLDSNTGKILKTSKFQEILEPGEASLKYTMYQYKIMVDKKGRIFIICGAIPALYIVDDNGNLLRKMPLPFKNKMKEFKINGSRATQWTDIYRGMTMMDDVLYIIFTQVSYDDNVKNKNHLIKVEKKGKAKILKTIAGSYRLAGSHCGNIYLYETDDYYVLPVSVNKFKKKD